MFRVLTSLLTCFLTASARDVGKTLRTMPIVTNSLVNLGKMDIAFYFNARPQDIATRSELPNHGSNPYTQKIESIITEPCPCSGLKYMKDSTQNHPSELLNKILAGNDLFSFKEPASSTLCCDSHENIHEDILFEFGPKQSQILANRPNSLSFLPYFLNSMQNKPSPFMMPKTKTVEILIFPKKQNLPLDERKKDNIKIVGDKEIRNDFKTYQFVPPFVSSVKKDLVIQDKSVKVTEGAETKTTVDNNSNTV